MNLQEEVRREDVLWVLASLCALFRIPFSAALLAQDYPPPYTLSTVHDAARALGIKTGRCALATVNWQALPLPLIAFAAAPPETSATLAADAATPATGASAQIEDAILIAETPATGAPTPLPLVALLIVKATDDRLLFFRPGSQSPGTMAITEAATRLAPEIILVAKEATTGTSKDGAIAGFAQERKAFGFSWFIPELKKHKNLWRDVLLASLLVDFFSPPEIAERVVAGLAEPERFADLRARARQTIVERYDLKRICLPAQTTLIAQIAGQGGQPGPAAPADAPRSERVDYAI